MSAAKFLDQDYYLKLATVVMGITGVQLTEKQRPMIESRISKRMRDLKFENIQDYYFYFEKNREQETPELITLLTTHHTFFFREFIQFEYLIEVLPRLVLQARKRDDRKIRVWSAGCSRGQEVYSLTMFLKYHLSLHAPDVQFEILGTDIDPQSVAIARNGVYSRKEISEIPLTYLGQHWVRGSGEIIDYAKAKQSLKEHCRFDVVNLQDIPMSIRQTKFDLIFCRNVFIYFKTEQIAAISDQFLNLLSDHGYLFLGVSESLKGMNIPSLSVGPSIYIKVPPEKKPDSIGKIAPLAQTKKAPMPLRVLCIDDSISILTLLKQILTVEEGFQIIGTAKNGIEAAQRIKELQVDLVTLDIHMPEQNGIEYLEKNHNSTHPPVVMVTAVSRDDSDLALRSLQLGAADYVEKPSLSNFNERADEIRTKLRAAHFAKQNKKAVSLDLDQSFQRHMHITKPEQKQRLIIASLSDRDKIAQLLKDLKNDQPPTYILIEGAGNVLPAFAKQLSNDSLQKIQFHDVLTAPAAVNTYNLGDFKTLIPNLTDYSMQKKTSILVLGQVTQFAADSTRAFAKSHLLLEEIETHPLTNVATDQVPFTSFIYLSNQFLEGQS